MDHLILSVCFSSLLRLSHPLYLLKTSCLLCMLHHDSLSQHVLHHLLPPQTNPAPSNDRGQVFPVLFYIWPRCPRALQSYFLMEPTPKALRHVSSMSFSSPQRLFVTVTSFYVKCSGCSFKSTSCFEEYDGRQLWHIYFSDLQDQEWLFSGKKSSGRNVIILSSA